METRGTMEHTQCTGQCLWQSQVHVLNTSIFNFQGWSNMERCGGSEGGRWAACLRRRALISMTSHPNAKSKWIPPPPAACK